MKPTEPRSRRRGVQNAQRDYQYDEAGSRSASRSYEYEETDPRQAPLAYDYEETDPRQAPLAYEFEETDPRPAAGALAYDYEETDPRQAPLAYEFEDDPNAAAIHGRGSQSRRRAGSQDYASRADRQNQDHTSRADRQNQDHASRADRQNQAGRAAHPGKKKKKKKIESFFFFYFLPFVLLNVVIFFLATAQPDFTLKIDDTPNDLSKVSFSIENKGRLNFSSLTVRLDDVPVEFEKKDKNLYTATVDRNGTLEVIAGYFNGMTRTQYEHISTIDDAPPTITGEELDGTLLTVSFEDAQSGINFDTIYAIDAGGARVLPESVDEANFLCSFRIQTNSLEVHVSDLCANEAIALFENLLNYGNSGEDRSGDYHRYGEGV